MGKLRSVIVDDNELDRLTLSGLLKGYSNFEVLRVFTNPIEALGFLMENTIDVLFLDVDMPGMSGLELRRKINHIPACIFITDHPEFALDSFELDTLDYLLKPISPERFTHTVLRIEEYIDIQQKAVLYEQSKDDSTIEIKNGRQTVIVNINEILYIKAVQNYSVIVTTGHSHYIRATLSNLLKENKLSSFKRVHKSYAINENQVISKTPNNVTINNGELIPIGRTYKSLLEL